MQEEKNGPSSEIDVQPTKEEQKSRQNEANDCFLIPYAMVLNLGVLLFGYMLGECNQMFPVLGKLFDWDEDEATRFSSLINTCGILGSACGAFSGGWILQFERRRTLIIINIVFMVGAAICTVESLAVICIGRFIKGVASFGFQILCPKIIFETAPVQSIGYLGSFTNTFISVGVFLTALLGLGFQDASTISTSEEVNNYWRFAFLFPIVFNLIQIVMLLFVYKHPSLVYCITNNQDEQALALIKNVYKGGQNHQDIMTYLKEDISNSLQAAKRESLKEVICDRRYRLATWMITISILLFYLSGLAPLIFYSTNLLAKMNEDSDIRLTPTVGTTLLGAATVIGSLLAPLFGKFLGTRPILILGELISGALYILMGILQITEVDIGVFVCMFLFVINITGTVGAKVYVFTSEIGGALGLSIGNFAKDIILILLSVFTQSLFDSRLKPEGVFFVFAGIAILGGIHHIFMVRETDGLSYEEKQQLYAPKNAKTESQPRGKVEHKSSEVQSPKEDKNTDRKLIKEESPDKMASL